MYLYVCTQYICSAVHSTYITEQTHHASASSAHNNIIIPPVIELPSQTQHIIGNMRGTTWCLHIPSLWIALNKSISTKEIQPKTLEYSESAHQKTLIPWLFTIFRPTLLLQEEVEVPPWWTDFTLFKIPFD